MNTFIKYLGSYLFITLLSFSFLPAQSQQGDYMHIDYLYIDADQVNSFSEEVENTIKPVQEARIENNSIKSWSLYKVAYPGSLDSKYNFVVITVSDEISDFEDIPSQVADKFSNRKGHSILEKYTRVLIPNHSELWGIRNSVVKNEISRPSRYIRINYMNVALGREYEYQMFEDEIARPLHEDRMELDQMTGWELFELILPGGTDYGYNFSTADYYENLENIEFGFTNELINQNHPNTNINEFFENMYRTRDLVRIELWELVDFLVSKR